MDKTNQGNLLQTILETDEFGLMPKHVILAKDLSIEAKTIYAYFCSIYQHERFPLPLRDNLLKDLKISYGRYYAHLQQLQRGKYIVMETCHFANTKCTISSHPLNLSVPSNAECVIIPKRIMCDSQIPLSAKGIYAFFCCSADDDNTATPRINETLENLQITINTYFKYIKYLTSSGYITTTAFNKINGRFTPNKYTLNLNNLIKEKLN